MSIMKPVRQSIPLILMGVLAGGAPEAVPFKVETRNFIFSKKRQ